MSHAAMDAASEQDRVFFEDHPDAQAYFREPVPGEMPNYEAMENAAERCDGVVLTKVVALAPGVRVRRLVIVGRAVYDRHRRMLRAGRCFTRAIDIADGHTPWRRPA